MTFSRMALAAFASLALAACGSHDPGAGQSSGDPAPTTAGNDSPAADTRPSGPPNLVTKEGRIESGVECPVLHTPDGEIWALSLGEADFGPGDYVSVTGEVADASFCMQGEGTILPRSIDAIEPPARDRDPARAGGMAVTSDYVTGSWVAKGVDADCSRPDFEISPNSNGMEIIETRVNGVPATGAVAVGSSPAFHWDEGIPKLPIETRGPDGLAVLPPVLGEVTLAGHPIEGSGVVFVKCA